MAARKAAGEIPASVPAAKAIARRDQYSGAIPLSQLVRLAPLLAETAGDLAVELSLSRDAAGGWLRGTVSGDLKLECQRGLHPFPWRCDLSVELQLVGSEAEEQRALEQSDPYLVQDDRLPLRDIVEDEVLLALPMMPRCGDENCIERFLK